VLRDGSLKLELSIMSVVVIGLLDWLAKLRVAVNPIKRGRKAIRSLRNAVLETLPPLAKPIRGSSIAKRATTKNPR
jgi:hypothetical protein